MKNTYNFDYRLGRTSTKSNEAQILMRVRKGNTADYRVKTRIYIPADAWMENAQAIKGGTRGTYQAEAKALQTLQNKVAAVLDDVPVAERCDPKWLQRFVDDFMGVEPEPTQAAKHGQPDTPICHLGELYLAAKGKKTENGTPMSEGRVRHFRSVFRSIARYEMYVRATDRSRRNYTFKPSATRAEVEAFLNYLHDEHDLLEPLRLTEPAKYDAIITAAPMERKASGNASYIHTTADDRKRTRSANYLADVEKKIRAFFAWCVDNADITGVKAAPYLTEASRKKEGAIYKSQKGTPIYLTMEERRRIEDASLDGRLAEQRDIFIFQCLTGMRVGDLMRLTEENILNGKELYYTPSKTEASSNVSVVRPLTPKLSAIIARYGDAATPMVEATINGKKTRVRALLPFISADKYNDNIRKVLTACGVTREVLMKDADTHAVYKAHINEVATSHMARKTFTQSLMMTGADTDTIQYLIGHSSGKMIEHYRNMGDYDYLFGILMMVE